MISPRKENLQKIEIDYHAENEEELTVKSKI
jgi:hypothetical protein